MADWYDRVRGNYQGAMNKPSQDWATILATLLGANVQKVPPQPTMFPTPSHLPDADLAQRPNIAPGAFAPSTADSDMAVGPPTQGLLAPYFPPKPAPASAPKPVAAAPQGSDAAFVPPPGWMPPADYMRTQNDADLGGYGGNPGRGRPIPAPQQYSNLNPTPGLEEVFRREYAANPNGFTPGRFFGLLGG